MRLQYFINTPPDDIFGKFTTKKQLLGEVNLTNIGEQEQQTIQK